MLTYRHIFSNRAMGVPPMPVRRKSPCHRSLDAIFSPRNNDAERLDKRIVNGDYRGNVPEMSALRVPVGRAVKTYGNAPAHI